MYLSIPDIFLVPVCYEKDIINIYEIRKFQEYINSNYFTNKFESRKDLVIGVAFSTLRDQRWIKDKEAMEAYAKQKKITLKMENAEFDKDKQNLQVESLLSQGIDALILVAVDVNTAGELVEKARKAGVKVVTYEALIIKTELEVYVGFNHLRAGEMQGRFLITKVPRGNYIIMYSDLPYDTTLKDGAMDYIRPLIIIGNIRIIAQSAIKDWSGELAYNFVKDALIANKNKVDAILAPNDSTAGGAIRALKEQGLAGKVVITGEDADLDAIHRVIEGTQSMTLFKDVRESAKKTIDAAITLINGEKIVTEEWAYNGTTHVPAFLIVPVFVDKSNIDEVLIKNGYYTKEEVYGTS